MFYKKVTDGTTSYLRINAMITEGAPQPEEFSNLISKNHLIRNRISWRINVNSPRPPQIETIDQFVSSSINTEENVELAILDLHDTIKEKIECATSSYINSFSRRSIDEQVLEDATDAGLVLDYTSYSGYSRSRLVTYNTSSIEDCNVQMLLVKHRTDHYISPYPKEVIDNFIPSDGNGFVELDAENLCFTKEIASQIYLNETFSSTGQPKRKWRTTWYSKKTIDSFNEFSYIPDRYKQNLIQAIGGRKIKCFELPSFYRGQGQIQPEIKELRSNKVLNGSCIFPVIIKVKFLNQTTLQPEFKKVLVFALLRNWERVVRYSRPREFLPSFLEEITFENGLKYFNLELYKQKMEELYGAHTQYWSGLTKVWEGDWSTAEPKSAQILPEEDVSPTALAPMFGIQQFKNSSTYKAYSELNDLYQGTMSKRDTQLSRRRVLNNNIERIREDINAYERYITRAKQQIQDEVTTLESVENELFALTAASESLKTEFDQAYSEYQEKASTITSDFDSARTWIQNLRKTGIIIESISYWTSSSKTDYETITQNPDLPINAMQTKDLLRSVTFRTTKPVIIYVDRGSKGEDCKKVVGGPYRVKLTESSLRISLLSSSACFGHNGSSIWIHPHTQSIYVDLTSSWEQFTNSYVGVETSACLGEASPILYNAFQNNDVKTAIFGAMTWVTSANSTDTWGKNYKYFPKLSEVTIDSEFSQTDEVETEVFTEEVVDGFIEQLAQMIEVPEEDDTAITQHEEILVAYIEDDQEEQEQEVETINLRNAGTPGYRPYGS